MRAVLAQRHGERLYHQGHGQGLGREHVRAPVVEVVDDHTAVGRRFLTLGFLGDPRDGAIPRPGDHLKEQTVAAIAEKHSRNVLDHCPVAAVEEPVGLVEVRSRHDTRGIPRREVIGGHDLPDCLHPRGGGRRGRHP